MTATMKNVQAGLLALRGLVMFPDMMIQFDVGSEKVYSGAWQTPWRAISSSFW